MYYLKKFSKIPLCPSDQRTEILASLATAATAAATFTTFAFATFIVNYW
jgi:hypothetical protein